MKRHSLLALMLAAVFAAGCQTNQRLERIHLVAVEMEPGVPPMGYRSQAAAIGGTMGGLIGGATASSSTRNSGIALHDVMQTNHIDVTEIVRSAFVKKLAEHGRFTPVENPSGADGTITLKIFEYGLFGDELGPQLGPALDFCATVKDRDGVSLRRNCGGGGPGAHWSKGRHKLEEFETNPDLLRIGFQNVADQASAMVVRGLER